MSWAYVGGTSAGNAGGQLFSAYVVSYTATAGNWLNVYISAYVGVSFSPTVSDGFNSYSSDWVNYLSPNWYTSGFHSLLTTGGALSISITPNVGFYPSVAVEEYSFTGSASFDVGSNIAWGSNTGTVSSGALTLAGNDLVCGVFGTGGAAVIGAGGGFTMRHQISFASGQRNGINVMDALNLTGSVTPSFTVSAAIQSGGFGVAYKTPIVAAPLPGRVTANRPDNRQFWV
jgi:hypothetical protein